ncbi:MAG: transcriptional activator hap3 [Paramarteilia canceri]
MDAPELSDLERILPLRTSCRVFSERLSLMANLDLETRERYLISNSTQKLIQEAVSEFMIFVCTNGKQKMHQCDRKKLTENHILESLSTLGFNDIVQDYQI